MHHRPIERLVLFCSILVIALLCQGLPAWGAQDGADVTVTGEVTVLYADDFDNKRSELRYTIREDHSGRTFNVRGLDKVPKKVKEKLKTGSVIKVRGKARGREIYLLANGTGSGVETVMPAAAAVYGEQRTIVL
ncbi:MAG: hypothetical protein R3231_02005, partial [bacterium]|nr:hypothetical protein [bacterium]